MRQPWHVLMDETDGQGSDLGGADEGNVAPHWSEQAGLPEELASAAFIRESKDIGHFAKQALDAHHYATGALRVPSEHASDEEKAAFRDKLRNHVPTLVELDPANPESYTSIQRTMGMPEKPDGYQLPEMDLGSNAPPAMDSQVAMFREVAHKNGLTNSQFQNVLKDIAETNARARMELEEQRGNELQALKDEWGLAVETKMSAARAVAQATHAPPQLLEAMEAGQVDAATLKWLAELHGVLGGASQVDSMRTDQGDKGLMTPHEAERQLAEIQGNKDHPYWRRADPRHAWAVQEYRRLKQLAMGEAGRQDHAIEQVVPISSFEGRA